MGIQAVNKVSRAKARFENKCRDLALKTSSYFENGTCIAYSKSSLQSSQQMFNLSFYSK